MSSRPLAAALAAALVAGYIAAGAGARPSRQSDVAYATAQVVQAMNVPSFVAPGRAFDAKSAAGKSIVVVPASSTGLPDLASMSAYTAGIRQAAEAVGVKVTTCSNKGTVKAQTACLNHAVSSNASAIVLVGSVDLVGLQSALAAVRAAKIPVVGAHVLAPGDFASGVDPGYASALASLTATVPAPYAQAAKLMADYVISSANGAPTTIALAGASDAPESGAMLATVQSEFAMQCGANCTVLAPIDVPYPNWQTQAYTAVKTATLAQSTGYLLPMFDQFDDLAAEGESDARDSLSTVTRPNICSYGGAPFAIQMGQAANRVVCDVAENMNWDGWATMDQTLRVLTGSKPLASEGLPLHLFTASNWFTETGPAAMSFPPSLDSGWGDPSQYINGYRALWGLSTPSDT
jgi:ribose transport system substrate-binding protein